MLELIIFIGIVIIWLIFLYYVKISPRPVFVIDKEFLQKMEKFAQLYAKKLSAFDIPIQQAIKAFQDFNEGFAKTKI